MDQLLFLLLELKRAQLMLMQTQSARTARIEQHTQRRTSVPSVKPVTSVVQPVGTTVTTAPTAPTPAPTADVVSQIEQYVLIETNNARARSGLPALIADTRVANIARAHSADMLSKNYFEHTNLSGCNAGCRLTNGGYVWKTYAENIHWMSGYKLSAQDSARKIVNDWMNSPGHRTNILGSYKYAGVGIAVSGDKIYSTTDYTTQ